MSELTLIPSSDTLAWSAALEELGTGDVYYTHRYVSTFEANGDGKAHLIVFRHALGTVVHPVLVRPIILSDSDTGYVDLISPYGYSGPWFSLIEDDHRGELARAFVEAMNLYCRQHGVVSELVRFHPLLGNHKSFESIIPVHYIRDTVYIDLRIPPDDLWRTDFAGRVRNDIRRARREGVEVVLGQETRMLETFERLYLSTMQHVGAAPYYFFSDSFFESLVALVKRHGIVAEARLKDRVIASTVLLHGPQYLHYHLSGSDYAFRNIPSTSLVLHEAIEWGRAAGLTYFHLGGGLGGKDDGLFRFKAGFSRLRSHYMLGKVIHLPQVYDELVGKHTRSSDERVATRTEFFPAYRSP